MNWSETENGSSSCTGGIKMKDGESVSVLKVEMGAWDQCLSKRGWQVWLKCESNVSFEVE